MGHEPNAVEAVTDYAIKDAKQVLTDLLTIKRGGVTEPSRNHELARQASASAYALIEELEELERLTKGANNHD